MDKKFRLPQHPVGLSDDTRIKYYSKNILKQKLISNFFENLGNIILGQPENVLDAGCGEGIAGSVMRQLFPKTEYYGTDLIKKSLVIAVPLIGDRVALADLKHMPFKNLQFDLVLCLEVLEHIPDWQVALEELIRISSRQLVISVPACPWYQLSNFVCLKNLKQLGEHPEHVNQFTREKLERALKGRNLSVRICNSFPWLICNIMKR